MARLKEQIVNFQKYTYRRVLGVADLFSIGYGDVGSSIYYALGATALYSLGATPISLAIAGFVFICTAFSYAEMASTFPEPGGSATFTRYAFNDLVSFIAGWGLLLDYIVTVAISAFTIPSYVVAALNSFGLNLTLTTAMAVNSTLLIILFLFILNVVGVRESTRFSWILAVFTVVTQALIILLGIFTVLNLPLVWDHLRIGVVGVNWSPSWPEFFKGTAMAMVAYTGIESIAQLAAETKKPGVTIPKAIKRTVLVLVFLYIGISVTGLSVLTPQELSTTYIDNPVAGIVEHFPIGASFLLPWIGLLAAMILLIASNAGLIGCSRLTFSMGEFYQVPRFFYRLHAKFRTPWVALAIFTALACAVVAASQGQMLFMADLYNFGAMIAFFSCHMSLLTLRVKNPALERPYLAPWNFSIGKGRQLSALAILGAVATFLVWVMVVVTKPTGRYVGLGWLAAGTLMYLLYRKRERLSATGNLQIEKMKMPRDLPLKFKNILVIARSTTGTDGLQAACQMASAQGAKITALYVLEIPLSLPIDAPIPDRELLGAAALKRAEAIGREHHVPIDLQLIRSRTLEGALKGYLQEHPFDLVLLQVLSRELHEAGSFAAKAERFLHESGARVWLCKEPQ